VFWQKCLLSIDTYTAEGPVVNSFTVTAHQPRFLTRLTRIAIALVTVWCLGCGAFESLVASLSRTASVGMNCGSDQTGGRVPPGGATVTNDDGRPSHDQIVGAPDHHNRGSYSCDCASCYSVSPVTIALALNPLAAPDAIPTMAAFFESAKREPLVPPPQLVS
jgi:hypothetical protein